MNVEQIPAALLRLVRERAENRCEYCRLAQEGQEATFHVDHVVPRSKGGASTEHNLALACVSCSLRKGARQDGVDPRTGDQHRLFQPRTDQSNDHFEVRPDMVVEGRTAIGRATVETLRLNRVLAVAIRQEESSRLRYP